MKRVLLTTYLLLSIFLPLASTFADDALIQQLLTKIDDLSARVKQLEAAQAGAKPEAAQADLDAITADTSPTSSMGGTPRKIATSEFLQNIASNTTIGGYATSEFENFEDKDSTFDQHRFVLNVASQLNKRLHFYSEFEFEHGAVVSSEGVAHGDISIEDSDGDGVIDAAEATDIDVALDTQNGRSGEIEVEQAWMQYDFNKNLGVRTGLILAPLGRFNINHDDDLHNLTDRPLVARRVIPTTWSEAGIGLVGNYSVGEEAALSAELYIINGLDDGFSAGAAGLRGARSSAESDNNNNKAVVGRVMFSPLLGQELALSGYHGDYDRAGNALTAAAIDWLFSWSNWRFTGEAARFDIEQGLNSSGDPAPSSIGGLFSELNYSFWFNALDNTFLGESFEDPKLISSFRYNYAEIDRRFGASTLDENSYVLGLAYRPVESFVIRTEYQWNAGELERKNSDGFIGSVAFGF